MLVDQLLVVVLHNPRGDTLIVGLADVKRSIGVCTILRIDTLCHEGLASQKVMRFSHLTFRKQNMPQMVQNKDHFGLN